MEVAPIKASETVKNTVQSLIESYFRSANTTCMSLIRVEPIDWRHSGRSYVLPPASRLGARSPKHWSELRNSTKNVDMSYAELAGLDDVVEMEVTGRVAVQWRGNNTAEKDDTTSGEKHGPLMTVHYKARLSHYRQIGDGNTVWMKVRPLVTAVSRKGEDSLFDGVPRVFDDFCYFPFQSMFD